MTVSRTVGWSQMLHDDNTHGQLTLRRCSAVVLHCCIVLRCAMLSCAMLCCAMLCCAVLCYAVLCYAMLCYVLCYAVLCYAMLCYATLCFGAVVCGHLPVLQQPSRLPACQPQQSAQHKFGLVLSGMHSRVSCGISGFGQGFKTGTAA